MRSQLRPVNFKGKVGASGYAPGGHEEWVGQVAGYTSEVTDEDFEGDVEGAGQVSRAGGLCAQSGGPFGECDPADAGGCHQ